MSKQPALTHFQVADLRPGMFVVEIIDQQGKVVMSQPGLVKTQAQIHELARRGVHAVNVDISRSQLGESTPEQPAGQPHRERSDAWIRQLYHDAQDLQCHLMERIRRDEPIDIQPLEQVAEDMVQTMLTQGDTMLCLARIRAKDAYLMEHSMNVAILLANFGRHMDLEHQVLKELTMGGLLHDVGKVRTPDEILHKPGRLTGPELEIMRQHATHGREILEATEGVTQIMLDVAGNHHECLDGSGYPRGLKGEELSLHSRMSTIVDVYDALTADRVYKKGQPCTRAFRYLMDQSGSHFDGELVGHFIKCMGVYPPGAVVRLSNHRLGIVMNRNHKEPLKPRVKVIYHAQRGHYEDVKYLDLGRSSATESIVESVDPKDFGIDLERFM